MKLPVLMSVILTAITPVPEPDFVFCSNPPLFYFRHNVDLLNGGALPAGYKVQVGSVEHRFPLSELRCDLNRCHTVSSDIEFIPGVDSWRVSPLVGHWSKWKLVECS